MKLKMRRINYNYKVLLWLIILVCLFTSGIIPSQNNPGIINFHKEQYHAYNKNWSISQDEKGMMYFGNDAGLLQFDGIEWALNKTPHNQMVRSVAAQSHNTIFTGSYEEFGRWDRGISGQLEYTSLSTQVDKQLIKNDDFWKTLIGEHCVYFQSFSSIYIYDYQSVNRLASDKTLLLLSKVNDEFWVQQMHGSIYRLQHNELIPITGSEIFENTDVRVILPYDTDKYLIGTTTKGIYVYDGNTFSEWNPNLTQKLNQAELNCGIISEQGTYYFGTILQGIFVTDDQGNTINHISTQNTLQNNTVLALFEDHSNNVWAALDKGIAQVCYMQNMSNYSDPTGNLGAVYDARLWNNKLFIGTNQGLFYIEKAALNKSNSLINIKLIEGTQGQVWSLSVIDDRLFCGHNKGLKEIKKNLQIENPYPINTGVFQITETTYKNRDVILLATYSGVRMIDKERNKYYDLEKVLNEPVDNIKIDHLGNIWAEHAFKGVYKYRLEDLSEFRNLTYYGGNSGDGLPYRLKIFNLGGRILLVGDGSFYTYDDIKDKIIPNIELNKCFEHIKDIVQIVPVYNEQFWALTNTSVHKFFYDGYSATITENYDISRNNLSMVTTYNNISVLNDSVSLICLDNGFLLYQKDATEDAQVPKTLPLPYLESFCSINIFNEETYMPTNIDLEIPYTFNTIKVRFSAENAYAENLSFQYQLLGEDQKWSEVQKINQISYPRLGEGKYTLLIRSTDMLGNFSETLSLNFKVRPPWYRSSWSYVAYLVLILCCIISIWLVIQRYYKKQHQQKMSILESNQLRLRNEYLQNEIEKKNAELLTQTSFIIKKNELILKFKTVIDRFYATHKTQSLIPLYQEINALLNSNLNTEDDWDNFLIKFEEKHNGFFKKMKTIYSDLTNSDLRLCACLKLNLDTKQIASLLNLSVRGVENSRYRLRKKLNLDSNQNLNDFLLSID